jgi:molecular chaperone DnaK (HSP70)
VKRRADEATGRPSVHLVLGRPVTLSHNAEVDARLEERFRQAAILAGFEEVDFVFEPVAASVNVAGRTGDTVLVFDFGGGTLDISLGRTRSDGLEVLANVGADLGAAGVEVKHQLVLVGVNRQPGNSAQPLAGQLQIGAAIGVEQLLFIKRQFHRLVPPY